MKIILLLLLSLPSLSAVKNIIILIPGAASSGDQISVRGLTPVFGPIQEGKYFKHLEKILKKDFVVFTCPKIRDRDTRNLSQRAKDCNTFLVALLLKNPYSKFHLVAHSMGGLVARKMVESFAISRVVSSVTTISTPHKGSVLATYAINNSKSESLVGSFIRLIEFTPDKRRYLPQLAIVNDQNQYSESLRNRFNIPIYSISNHKHNLYNTPLAISSTIIKAETKKYRDRSALNDGIIETSSMIFGRHLGQIKADHMESGCVLYTKYSKGCKRLLALLIPHLKSIIE
jgi:pimeloyl-ACP methyl ester carboxylesterase